MATPKRKPCLERYLEMGLRKVGDKFYTGPALLRLQTILGFVIGGICALYTKRESSDDIVPIGVGSLGLCFCYVFWLTIASHSMFVVELRVWCRKMHSRYYILLHALRVIGIIGLLLAFVFLADKLGKAKDLDGFATGTFLSLYLHVASLLKLFGVHDEFCASDSLLATSVMLAYSLEKDAGVVHLPRVIISFLAAFVLVCFRLSTVPYERNIIAKVENEILLQETQEQVKMAANYRRQAEDLDRMTQEIVRMTDEHLE